MTQSKYVHIKRDDIAAINDLLANLRSRIDLPPKHPMQSDFANICLGKKFLAEAALPILLDDIESNDVFKKFLFAAFCGWVIDPTDDIHSVLLMELEAKRHIVRSEGLYEVDDDAESDGLDIISRYVLTGEDFDDDIFRPLGGSVAVLYSGSEIDVENFLSTDIQSLQSMSYYLNILRAMQDIEVSGNKFNISKNRIIQFADEAFRLKAEWVKKEAERVKKEAEWIINGGKRPNKQGWQVNVEPDFPSYLQRRSKIHEMWSRNSETLALLHAAAHVRESQKRTLLEAILAADFDPEKALPKLREWIGKAVYFSTNYLSPIGNAGQSQILTLATQMVEPVKFKAQKLNSFEELLVRRIMTKTTKSAP
jgi:hypothetical protein